MLKCPRCGEENSDKELYCGKCHDRLPSISALRSTMRAGLEALEEKNYRKALERFDELVSKNPGDTDGWFLRAACQIKMGNATQAWKGLVEMDLAVETARCSQCRGLGKCRECGGPGICIMCRGTKKCSYCGGQGSCPTCKGQKSDECNHCKGSGECIRCLGTKECTYCKGFGHCQHCKGSGNCANCGGTGKGYRIDIGKISSEFRPLESWFG